MKKEESKREELNLTRLKQACKTMALFLVCCWIRGQPFWTSKHYVSFWGWGAGGKNLHEKRAKVSSDKQPKLFVLKTQCLLHL